MRGREDRGLSRARRAPAEQGGSLHTGGVHDGAHVVEQDADIGGSLHPVGHADAALVEEEYTEVAGQGRRMKRT
jgi:hypothetical protein